MKYWLFLFCIIAISCSKSHQQVNEIKKVELAGHGNWSLYGSVISIDDSLNLKYYDGQKKKNYVGKINPTFWDTINQKLKKIDFKTVREHSDRLIFGGRNFELIIFWKNGKKRIARFLDPPLDSVTSVMAWLESWSKKVMLREVNYPLKFETTYQN